MFVRRNPEIWTPPQGHSKNSPLRSELPREGDCHPTPKYWFRGGNSPETRLPPIREGIIFLAFDFVNNSVASVNAHFSQSDGFNDNGTVVFLIHDACQENDVKEVSLRVHLACLIIPSIWSLPLFRVEIQSKGGDEIVSYSFKIFWHFSGIFVCTIKKYVTWSQKWSPKLLKLLVTSLFQKGVNFPTLVFGARYDVQ